MTTRRISAVIGSVFSGTKAHLYDSTNTHHPKRLRVWGRIIGNLVAFVAIFASLSSMFILIYLGALEWEELHILNQSEWNLLGNSCILTSSGFVLQSCSFLEQNLMMSPSIWSAMGQKLAAILDVPINTTYKVTTCIAGCTLPKNQTQLHLLVGYDKFPVCSPLHGSQSIAGLAMIEAATTISNAAFMMTTFSDASMNQTIEIIDSRGQRAKAVANVSRMLIHLNGSSSQYELGVNSFINSSPFTRHYGVESWCKSQILDTSADVSTIQGWSTGKYSHTSIVPARVCSHHVAQPDELGIVHIILVILTIGGIAGDIFITLEGLRGVLKQKPVLTYDILSGVERRKGVLAIGAFSAFPGVIFVEIGRLYFGTAKDTWFWFLSVITLSVFVAWTTLLLTLAFQYIPSPKSIRHRLTPWSGSIFIYSSIPIVALSIADLHQSVHTSYFNTPSLLALNVSGTYCGCGAYSLDPVDSVFALTWWRILLSLTGCFAFSIVYAVIKHYIATKRFFLDVHWTHDNAFMNHFGCPYWFTGLPLDQSSAIKIGNRYYCKPNLQVRMALAVVISAENMRKVIVRAHGEDEKTQDTETYVLVSIYDLVPAMVPCLMYINAPRIVGQINKNTFSLPAETNKRLSKGLRYTYTRGSCVG